MEAPHDSLALLLLENPLDSPRNPDRGQVWGPIEWKGVKVTTSASKALHRLREGNRRFWDPSAASRASEDPSLAFSDLSAGQAPFAAVLGCSDSRVPVEAIFSQGPGALFVVRVAGNVVGEVPLGSLEFAVGELGVELVLVLGHTHCGAVGAALTSAAGPTAAAATTGNLRRVVEPIVAAIRTRKSSPEAPDSLSPERASRMNVEAACEGVVLGSPFLASRVESGQLTIVGSVYDLKTGRVEFLEGQAGPGLSESRNRRAPQLNAAR